MGALRSFVKLLSGLGLLFLLLGYLGQWLALGDSFAVGRLQVSFVLLALSALLFAMHSRVLAFVLVAASLGAGGTVLWGFVQPQKSQAGTYQLYQKNLLGRAWPRYSLANEIVGLNPDFVTLQEVSDHNLRFMRKMFEFFPSQISCDFLANKSVAVLSRHPVVPGTAQCDDRDGLALMQVEVPDQGRVWLASVHLLWPFPYDQAQQVGKITERLKNLTGPVLLGGDFNMVPWGSSVSSIAQSARMKRVGPYRVTYPKYMPVFPFPIDHILLPAGANATIDVRPLLGSDHLGLLARFDL